MPRRRRRQRLNVFLNGRHVGELNREPGGAIDFKYAAEWLAWPMAIPASLSLPLREDRYIGQVVSNVFDNLLPDNPDIRRRAAERVGAEGVDAFSLLAALGRDCVGALQFLPDDAEPPPVGPVSGRALSEAEIADTLRNLARSPLGLTGREDSDAEAVRLSIAGAQEKTALLRAEGRWLRPRGATPTTHILKPQIGQLPNGIDLSNSVENEYLCLKLTEALGLQTASVEMASFEDQQVLVVERFDRLWDSRGRLLRVPQEDCCQALSVPWTRKYEADGGPGFSDIARLLTGSDEPQADQRRFLKAVLVFWLLGAPDGHAKNFSIFLSPGGGFRLTPLYDVLSVQPTVDAGRLRRGQFKLAMAVGDSRHYTMGKIAPRHFGQSAVAAGLAVAVADEMMEELADSGAAAIRQTVQTLPGDFPEAIAASITEGLTRRLGTLATRNSRI